MGVDIEGGHGPESEAPHDSGGPKYSVVVPCFRSEKSLPELIARLEAQFEDMGETYEVIFVDDASPDGVGEVVRAAREKNDRITLIQHFRNYGQHQALLTGFRYVKGEYVITLDDDLQHPPEEIPRLIEAVRGADVVMGVPEEKQHGRPRKAGSLLMRSLLKFVFRPPPGFASSAFRLLTAPVASQLAKSHTVYPYISGMILRFTPNVVSVPVRHEPRKFGRSTYSMSRLVRLASNLIINYTKVPLQTLVAVGVLVSVLSFAGMLYVVANALFFREFQAGWPSLIAVISFFGGLNLIGLAVIGEYLIRLLGEVQETQRPVVREVWGS